MASLSTPINAPKATPPHLEDSTLTDAMQGINLDTNTPKSPIMLVTVNVGDPRFTHPTRDTFLVPRADLTRTSAFFTTHLSNPHTTTFDLPDIRPALFSRYLTWHDYPLTSTSFSLLASLFTLATRLQDTTFARAVLRAIIRATQELGTYPELRAINIIYAASKKGSGARRLLTDFYVFGATTEWLDAFEKCSERVDQEYIDDVLVGLAARGPGVRALPWEREPEAYLGEGDGEEDVDSFKGEDFDDREDNEETMGEDEDEYEEYEEWDGEQEQDAMDVDCDGSSAEAFSGGPPMPSSTFTLTDRTRY